MKQLLAVAVLAVTVAACSPGPPYHRNPADAAACRAFETAVAAQGTDKTANIDAISAGMSAKSPDLGDLITQAFSQYGDPGPVIAWCDRRGYPDVAGPDPGPIGG